MGELRAIGFWFNPYVTRTNRFPIPQRLVAAKYSISERDALTSYLAKGSTFARYRGFSSCRFLCNHQDDALGFRDLFDGEWVWPEGLYHYVAEHDVKLPDEFREHALRQQYRAPVLAEPTQTPEVGFQWWSDWAIQQGAVLDLNGWESASEYEWRLTQMLVRLDTAGEFKRFGSDLALVDHLGRFKAHMVNFTEQSLLFYDGHDLRVVRLDASEPEDVSRVLAIDLVRSWLDWPLMPCVDK